MHEHGGKPQSEANHSINFLNSQNLEQGLYITFYKYLS